MYTKAISACGVRIEYQPKSVDALWLGSNGRSGFDRLWINMWVAVSHMPYLSAAEMSCS